MRRRALSVLLVALAACWGAPLLGLLAARRSVAEYLVFPPRTVYVPHAAFDWAIFAALAVPALAALVPYAVALARARPGPAAAPRRKFPWWGGLGLALVAGGWWLAWSRIPLATAWRQHSFTVLWLGYILVVNGLAWRRSGRALLTARPRLFLALFPASSVWWWLFEYLNQYVANWYYGGVRAGGAWNYFLQASLPFSTVLPAVASTWAWLAQSPRLEALALPPLRAPRALAWLALAGGVLALALLGLGPQALFPFLWVGPLLLLSGLQQLTLGETLFAPLARGDWRPLLQPALAALVCGFFWEMWNYGSSPKWHYSLPYVERFRVFEMPLLGYAGYLPFGIECALLLDLVARLVERRGLLPLLPPAQP